MRAFAPAAGMFPGRSGARGAVRRIVAASTEIRVRRGGAALVLFLLFWYAGVSSKGWLGIDVPWVGRLP